MRTVLTIVTAALIAAMPAGAQLKLPGGMGGIPGVGSAGIGNAAGLLGYCLKNRLLGATGGDGAAGVLGKLTGRKEVTQSPGFALGQLGQVQQPGGGVLPLGGLTSGLKTQVCNQVLKRAGSFL